MLGLIYFGIGQGMLPKIQSTVELRDKQIADDLAAAEQARAEADETEEAYRAADGRKPGRGDEADRRAKQAGAKATEKQGPAKADAAIQAKLEQGRAEDPRKPRGARSPTSKTSRPKLTQDIVAKVAGIKVSHDGSGRSSQGGVDPWLSRCTHVRSTEAAAEHEASRPAFGLEAPWLGRPGDDLWSSRS